MQVMVKMGLLESAGEPKEAEKGEDGSIKNIHDIPEDLRRVISGLKVVETYKMQGKKKVCTGKIKAPGRTQLLLKIGFASFPVAVTITSASLIALLAESVFSTPNGSIFRMLVTN